MTPIDTISAHDTEPTGPTLAQRIVRALAPVLITTLTLQPLTLYAAPSPSLLSQSPKLLDTSVPANVVFLMDDSLSMDDIRLPVPPGLNPNESAGGQVTVRGQATGYSTGSGAWTVSSAISVERVNEWIFRNAVLNPLYYNPAITYRPWNDNGRDGTGNFQNAGVGATSQVTDATTNFRFSLTRQDMRYAGPNYTYGNQNNFGWRNTALGSNPAAVPAYLQATRPASGGFAGAVDAQNRNQDLFTSVMVLANGGAQQCVVAPVSTITTAQPTVSRGAMPQPTVQRVVVPRSSTPQATSARSLSNRGSQASTSSTRDVQPRTSSAQPSTAATTTNRTVTTRTTQTLAATTTPTLSPRPGTAQATSNRTASVRPSTPQTVTTRATTALPATTSRLSSARPATAQGVTNRAITTRASSTQLTSTRQSIASPLEYRQETGVCGAGTFTTWTTTVPSQNFCSDPNSEGGVRVAQIESRYRPCQSGYTASGAQCISDCPIGYSVNPTNSAQCLQDCPSGVVANGQCYGTCPTGTTVNAANNQQCIADCPAGTTVSGTQCLATCPAGTNLINGQCYGACPAGTSIDGAAATSTQCITNCPAGTVASGNQCVGTCPTGYTASGNTCYQNCASGSYVDPSNVAQCLSNCASGVTSANRCYSGCPTGTSVHPTDPLQCLTNCPSGWTASGTQCMQNCAVGTNLINGICYGACPSGSTLDTGNATTATQCRSNCPTGTTLQGGQCVGVCSTGFTNISGTCYSNCPAGTAQNPSNVGQCLSNCPVGTQVSNSNVLRCVSCSSGTLSNTATSAVCLQACAAGNTLISGLCYQNSCPTNYNYNGSITTATSCIANCPTFSTASGGNCINCTSSFPTLIGNVCYANCPAGTTVHTTNTQCISNCPAGSSADPGNALQCLGSCTGGATLIAGQCYAATCPAGYSLNGTAGTATQCISDCPTGYTVDPGNANQCIAACPASNPNLVGTTCYADCPSGYTVNGSNQAQCLGSCPTGATLSNGVCTACPSGTSPFGTNQCCPSNQLTQGNCPVNRPAGADCSAGKWVPDFDQGTPARYYVFAPAATIASPSPAQLSDPGNYVQVRIDRDIPMNFPRAASRTDCANTGTQTSPGYCTWAEEAQNFANWYTYYRTRLFSAIGVTSAALSNLTADRGLDSLRLGYGSINYFPEGANPYPNINPLLNSRLPATMSIDGQPSNGALVRGVRPFQQLSSTPPAPGSDDRRQEVFDWLFSLRAISATPNREAIDSVGRYFQRTDNRGPWIRPATTNETLNWQTNEAATAHVSCRRNFTILVTDGEWTRAPYVTGAPQQPLVENTSTPLATLSVNGPQITGLGNRSYEYRPASEPQWSTNASSAGATLSDIAFYYWSRDLRTDLPNNVRPVDPTDGRQGNPAFWQHLVPYIVGYGISASMDTSATRQAVIASAQGAVSPISWPGVRLEDRATEIGTVVTDRDTTPINCGYDPSTNPSGCGRVNDTLRAALAARGDFLSATDVSSLAAGIASAFTAIGQLTGSSTALTGRSGTVRQGDRLFQATFQTNVWSGRLQSFDALTYYNSLSGTALDAGVSQRFPAPASRNVLTSTALSASGVAFPTADSDFTNLSAAQRTALGNDSFVPQWLRGDQSRDGAGYRKRAPGEILGDIVNSQPLFTHWTDHGYSAGRAPAAAGSNAATYPQFVRDNRQYRPARIYVGANDGMLHAFDASGTPASNTNYLMETFAYVPRAVYGALETLASPNYVHQYSVDGPVIEGDVFINGAWRSVLVGTTGAGPKGVFAIDVTQRTGMTARSVAATDVLWDLAPALDSSVSGMDDVGNIMQPGVIGSGRDGEWYYFVGNGYESASDKAKLLAIRIRDGAIFPIGTDNVGGSNPSANNVSNQPNGLGGVTPIYDGNRNIVAIYAGDRLGRLWKFDLSSTNRNDWASATGTTPLFTAAAANGARQAITAAPRLVAHPLGGRMIVFGTGKVFENNDLMDMTVQAVYGVWEKQVNATAAVAKSSLREFTLADITDPVSGAKYRQLQNTTSLNWATDLGWYFNLSSGTAYGERVVASPNENFGFVNVTSFEPAANGDPCVGGGRSFFYRLDIAGSFTRAPFSSGGLNNLDASIPRNTVVGAELEGPTISGVQTLLKPVDGTTSFTSSLTTTDTAGLAGATESAATNCNTAVGGGVGAVGNALATPTLNCPVAPLRIWRELPRTPR